MTADQKEGQIPPIALKQVLVETTFKPGRVYEGPDSIDLATLQPVVEELIDYTLEHPGRHEAARLFLLEPSGRLVTNKAIQQGREQGHVQIDFNLWHIPGWVGDLQSRQQRFVAAAAHSHPTDGTFSPPDLIGLLTADTEISFRTAEILITPHRKVIAFRGANTPQLSMADASKKMYGAHQAVDRRIQLNGPFTNPFHFAEVEFRAGRAMIRQLAEKYDLQFFEGGVRDRFLRRIPASQIAANPNFLA